MRGLKSSGRTVVSDANRAWHATKQTALAWGGRQKKSCTTGDNVVECCTGRWIEGIGERDLVVLVLVSDRDGE